MHARHMHLRGLWLALAALAMSGSAQALALKDLKGQGMEAVYGTYAPGGDCRREPRVIVGDAGFTFRYHGQTALPQVFVLAASFYTGAHGEASEEDASKTMFFPFPTGVREGKWGPEVSGYGPLSMAIDSKTHSLAIETGGSQNATLTPLQAALAEHSPYVKCGAHAASAPAPSSAVGTTTASPGKIVFGKDRFEPTAVQTAAIRHAAASDIAEFSHPEQGGYLVAEADLNDDGHPDLLVQYDDIAFCGSSGCSGVIVMATPHGYSGTPIDLPNFYGEIDILPSIHHGMHDLRYGDSPVWAWNGRAYGVAKADLPGADAPAWETRQAMGRTVALVAPIESVIKSISAFCNQGAPVLAMVVKARPPAGPVTLTWVFRGWTVNVPMAQGNREATLWMANLSRSDLPLWLAHRGNTPTTRKLAKLASEAFLRINGGMQGEVSLQASASATQAALGSCYRY